MKFRVGTWIRVGLVLLGVLAVPVIALRAQSYGSSPIGNLTGGWLLPLPPAPPRGAWGEVIFANERWIVIQNHQGQQFPISADSINQFLIRWPTTFAALTPQSWVEAIGVDIGSNTLRTGHVDVYEGADRNLVQPTYRSVLPTNAVVTTIDPTFNRMMNAFDIASQNMLYGWAYPINPGGNGIPGQLYVVGNAVRINPLQLGTPGNNFATVLPDDSGIISITQVSRGTASFAEKGDFAFLTPVDLTAKSLVLAQLVLYKKIPMSQFVAP